MSKKTWYYIGAAALLGIGSFFVYKTMQKRKSASASTDKNTVTTGQSLPPENPSDRASFGEDFKEVVKESLADARDKAKSSLSQLM